MENVIIVFFKKSINGEFVFLKSSLSYEGIETSKNKIVSSGINNNGNYRIAILDNSCSGILIDENQEINAVQDIDDVRLYLDEDETQDIVFAFHNLMQIDIDGKMDKYSNLMQAEGKTAYQKYFTGKLQKYGVDSPAELSDKQKSKFFSEVEQGWNAQDE